MGCTSSSLLITSTGSEMLKSVSRETSEGVRNAAQDVAHTMEQTLDTAKETIGDALTNVANDVGSAMGQSRGQSENVQENPLKKLPPNEHQDTKEKRTPERKDKIAEQSTSEETEAEKATTTTTAVSVKNKSIDITDGGRMNVPESSPLANSLETSKSQSEIDKSLNKSVSNGQLMPLESLGRETEESSTKTQHQDPLNTVQRIDASIKSVEKVVEIVLEEKKARNIKKLDDEYLEKTEEEKLKNDKENKTHETVETSSTSPTASSPVHSSSVENAFVAESQLPERPATTEWEKHADMLSKQRRHHNGDAFKKKGNFRNSIEIQSQRSRERATQFNRTIDDIVVSQQRQQQSDSGTGDWNKTANSSNHTSDDNSSFNSNNSSEENGTDQNCHQFPPANAKHFQRKFTSLFTGRPNTKSGQFMKIKPTNSCAPSRIPSRLSSPANASSIEKRKPRQPRLTRSSTTMSLIGNPMSNNIITFRKPNTKPREKNLPLTRSPSNFRDLHSIHRTKRSSNQNILRRVSSRSFIVGDGGNPMKSQAQSNFVYSSFLPNSAHPRGLFSFRKNNHELATQQLKSTYMPDLNGPMPKNRGRLSPCRSPYRISERCSVCNNKFLI